MYEELKNNISNEFMMNGDEFYKSLRVLHFFRNLAAHNQRTFDSKAEEKIDISEEHRNLGLKNTGLNDVMSVIIICKKLLERKDFNDFTNELIVIFDELIFKKIKPGKMKYYSRLNNCTYNLIVSLPLGVNSPFKYFTTVLIEFGVYSYRHK